MENLNKTYIPIDRSVRQHECLVKWVKNKCVGTLECCTAFGKTYMGITAIEAIHKHYPDFKVLVVVPTDIIQKQWQDKLNKRGLSDCTNVQIINTVIKHEWYCNLLIIDEAHRAAANTFVHVFTQVHYRYILCLTATLERLDGRDQIIRKYCPVVDRVTLAEALINHWISDFTEYQVLIDVPDIDIYDKYNSDFNKYFEFFNYNFPLVMSMCGQNGWKAQTHYRDTLCPNGSEQERKELLKLIKINSAGFMRCMTARKKFINNHPKKLKIVEAIIAARKDCKIITFADNIAMARKIKEGKVYSSRSTEKQNKQTLEEFNSGIINVLNTSKKADEGLSVNEISIAIIFGTNSSKTKAIQRAGRALRFVPDKKAEIFNIVINHSVETEWFRKAHSDSPYITIDEENLYKVLKGEPFETYKKPIQNLTFRF